MQETIGQRRTVRPTGIPLIAVAFLGGAVLGALLVVFFCAFMPEGGVMPRQASRTLGVAPQVTETVPLAEPVSVDAAQGRAWNGLVPAEGYGLQQSGAGDMLPKATWQDWSRHGHWGVMAATACVLFACLVGAAVLIWSGRRANVRLEARVQRFEQLLAQHKGKEGWLNNLDADLEGEWKDSR